MGNAAIVGMMLSSVGVYLVWTTFNATREANTLAKRALFNSERPYLCIDVRDSRFVAAHDSQEGRANLWQWSFTNMGVSPARLTHTHVESVYLPAGQWPPPIHRSMTGGSAFPHGLFIGSSKVLHAQVFRIKEFDPETSERLLVQNLYAWIYGFICYESIAGDAYITGFCLKNGNGDHVGEVSLQGGETYNYFRGDDPNAPPAERVRSGDIPIRY